MGSRTKKKDKFEIATYKHLGDEVGVSNLADDIKKGMHYISKKEDKNEKGTGLVFYVEKDSNNNDFRKAVRALSKIMSRK